MVGKVDLVIEKNHKHVGEVAALAFDKGKETLYSGSADGVISVWDKNLKFNREIPIHKDFALLSLVLNDHNQMYSSGRDGSLRYFRRPWSHDMNDIMLQTVMDDVTCLFVHENTLFSGDDKGIVTKWYHNQVSCQYNVMEEVKSMAVEDTTLYTVRETDVVITDIKPHMLTHVVKGTTPGRAPLLLIGPEVNKHKKFLVCATRDGKGFIVINNDAPYKAIATKENAHSMIINAMCTVDNFLFTAGFDGKVKKWKDLAAPKMVDEVDTGRCINTMCAGPDHTVFVGDSEGFIKRIRFSA